MTRVIRSKNAGINKTSYDVFFNTEEDYDVALQSGCFTTERMAETLEISPKKVIGCYRYDDCMAIKICTHRGCLSGSVGDRDIFGSQQHARLLNMEISLYK